MVKSAKIKRTYLKKGASFSLVISLWRLKLIEFKQTENGETNIIWR